MRLVPLKKRPVNMHRKVCTQNSIQLQKKKMTVNYCKCTFCGKTICILFALCWNLFTIIISCYKANKPCGPTTNATRIKKHRPFIKINREIGNCLTNGFLHILRWTANNQVVYFSLFVAIKTPNSTQVF